MTTKDKADGGYSYKKTAKYSVPLCDESTGYQTIYVTPEYAKIHERIRNTEWAKHRRSLRCIIVSERYGNKRCSGKCSECPHRQYKFDSYLSEYVEDDGELREPKTGEWKDVHEAEDPRLYYEKEERSRMIKSNVTELIGEIGYSILKAVYGEGYTIEEVSSQKNINLRTLKRHIKKWVDIIKQNKERFF